LYSFLLRIQAIPQLIQAGRISTIPRPSSSLVLFSVLIGVRLRGFLSVVGSMQMVAMCDMGMVSALFMRSFFVMSGRLFVMAGRVLVMFSGLLMMFRSFVLEHFAFSICSHCNLIIQKGNVLERHRVNRVKVNTDRPGCRPCWFGVTPQRYGI
jgi:hypothetical protein